MKQVYDLLVGFGYYVAAALAICTPGFIRSWLEAIERADGAGVEPKPPRSNPSRLKPGWMGP
jgi:hypothetical protein